jgi:hypothetical protein
MQTLIQLLQALEQCDELLDFKHMTANGMRRYYPNEITEAHGATDYLGHLVADVDGEVRKHLITRCEDTDTPIVKVINAMAMNHAGFACTFNNSTVVAERVLEIWTQKGILVFNLQT